MHALAAPLIEPGVAGTAPALTVVETTDELPQPLSALIVIVPPEGPAVARIVSVIEVPDHPLGRVQV